MMKKLLFVVMLFALFNSVHAAETIIFNDNFNDGSITDWDVNTGVWTGAAFYLDGGAIDGGAISHSVSGMTAGRTYRMHFTVDRTGAGNSHFFWMTDQNNFQGGNVNGYDILPHNGILRKITNGSNSTILTFSAIGAGVHDINITHRYDGNISIYIDGAPVGGVIDTTFNKGTKIGFGNDNSANSYHWDDLNILFTGDTNEQFRIVDESSLNGIPASLTVNGNPWPVGSTGSFDVNNSITFPLTLVATATGYSSRTFYFDTNAGLYEKRQYGLRATTATKSIDFLFYDTDQTTKLSDRIIVVLKSGIVAGRVKTDSLGRATIPLAPQDSGYTFQIKAAGSDTTTASTYTPVTITLKHPFDEVTNAQISKNYDYSVGGLGSQSATNISGNTSIIVLPNTIQAYNIYVDDTNSSFDDTHFPRTYSKIYKGNPGTDTLQPYLVSVNTGIAINYNILDKFTFAPLPGFLLTAKKGINGSDVIVEQYTTNAAGLAQFIFLARSTYNLTIEDLNTGITYPLPNNGAYSPIVSTGYTIYIPFTTADTNYTNLIRIIDIKPYKDVLTGASQTIDVNITTNYATRITVRVLDNNRVAATSTTTNQTLFYTNNFTLADFNRFMVIEVSVQSFGGATIKTKTYTILSEQPGLLGAIKGFKDQGGIIVALIVTLLGLLLVLQAYGPSFSGNNESQLFVTIIVLTLFSLFFFFNPNIGPNEPDYMMPLYAAVLFGVIGFWYFKGGT